MGSDWPRSAPHRASFPVRACRARPANPLNPDKRAEPTAEAPSPLLQQSTEPRPPRRASSLHWIPSVSDQLVVLLHSWNRHGREAAAILSKMKALKSSTTTVKPGPPPRWSGAWKIGCGESPAPPPCPQRASGLFPLRHTLQ